MPYVMVNAVYSDVSQDQQKNIFSCLKSKQWKKLEEFGDGFNSVWIAKFTPGHSENAILQETKNDFISCARGYCTPKLLIHYGNNKPFLHDK